MNTRIRRQGDLILKRVEETGVEGTPIKDLVLAEGEVTGHRHILVAEVGSTIVGTATKFTLKGTAKLLHPEHTKFADRVLTSGTYVVIHEVERDPAEDVIRQVQDQENYD